MTPYESFVFWIDSSGFVETYTDHILTKLAQYLHVQKPLHDYKAHLWMFTRRKKKPSPRSYSYFSPPPHLCLSQDILRYTVVAPRILRTHRPATQILKKKKNNYI